MSSCRWSVCRPDCQRFGFKVAQFPSQKQVTSFFSFYFPNLFIALGSPRSRYLIKSEEIMKGYPLPSNENYPNRNGHIFTLHLKLKMSDPLDCKHDTNPKGCVL